MNDISINEIAPVINSKLALRQIVNCSCEYNFALSQLVGYYEAIFSEIKGIDIQQCGKSEP